MRFNDKAKSYFDRSQPLYVINEVVMSVSKYKKFKKINKHTKIKKRARDLVFQQIVVVNFQV